MLSSPKDKPLARVPQNKILVTLMSFSWRRGGVFSKGPFSRGSKDSDILDIASSQSLEKQVESDNRLEIFQNCRDFRAALSKKTLFSVPDSSFKKCWSFSGPPSTGPGS